MPRNGTVVPYADDAWLIATQDTRSCALQAATNVAVAATSVAFTEGLLRDIVGTSITQSALGQTGDRVPTNGTSVPYADDAWLIVTDKTVEEVLPSTGSVTESVTVVTFSERLLRDIIGTTISESLLAPIDGAVPRNGTAVPFTERLCDDDDEAGLMIRRATTGKVGRPSKDSKNSDNVTNNGARGNRKSYTLDRLDRERPGPFYRL